MATDQNTQKSSGSDCNLLGFGEGASDVKDLPRYNENIARSQIALNSHGYMLGEKLRADAINFVSRVKQIELLAIAIADAYQVIKNFRRIRRIQREALRFQEKERDRLKNTYWNREIEFLKEHGGSVGSEPIDDFENLKLRLAARIRVDVAKAFKDKMNELKCNARRYCQSEYEKLVQDLMIERGKAMANAYAIASDMAFSEVQALRDLNFQRRMQAVGMGKGLAGQAASFMSAGLGALQGNLQGLMGSLNSALQGIGYANQFGQGVDYHPSAMMMAGGDLRQPINTGSVYQPMNGQQTMANPYANSSVGAMATQATSANLGGSPDTGVAGRAKRSALLVQEALGAKDPGDFIPQTAERINHARIGNQSLARYGEYTYTFKDSRGDVGSITVNMEDFHLYYTDADSPRDGKKATGGRPIDKKGKT